MTRFRILFGIDLLIVIFALWQCYMIGTSTLTMTSPDGTATVIPQDRWLLVSPIISIAAFATLVLGGAAALQGRGRSGLATLLLLIPAVPVILGMLLMLGLMTLFWLGTPSR